RRFLGLRISPLNQRRWRNFRTNKRGFWSLWIFVALFLFTLPAEFVANEKPIFIWYDGKAYMPVLYSYPQTTFGGDFETEADYRDPYIIQQISAKGWMFWPLIPFSYRTVITNLPPPGVAPSPPTADNWLGTDDHARDIVARLIYGFRISVLFGLVLTT